MTLRERVENFAATAYSYQIPIQECSRLHPGQRMRSY